MPKVSCFNVSTDPRIPAKTQSNSFVTLFSVPTRQLMNWWTWIVAQKSEFASVFILCETVCQDVTDAATTGEYNSRQSTDTHARRLFGSLPAATSRCFPFRDWNGVSLWSWRLPSWMSCLSASRRSIDQLSLSAVLHWAVFSGREGSAFRLSLPDENIQKEKKKEPSVLKQATTALSKCHVLHCTCKLQETHSK